MRKTGPLAESHANREFFFFFFSSTAAGTPFRDPQHYRAYYGHIRCILSQTLSEIETFPHSPISLHNGEFVGPLMQILFPKIQCNPQKA